MNATLTVCHALRDKKRDSFHDRGHWSFDPRLHSASLRRNRKQAESRSRAEQDALGAAALELEQRLEALL